METKQPQPKTISQVTPSTKAVMIAAIGMVIIKTDEGDLVLTPDLARKLSAEMSRFADLAEGIIKDGIEEKPGDIDAPIIETYGGLLQ